MKTAKKYLQDKYPQMRGHLWNSNPNINDEWLAEIMEEYASTLKELVKAYEHLLDCFGMSAPQNKTFIDDIDEAWERITELTNNLK